ncbi:DUF2235 domain-containing protein [Pseudofrankia sp. BMG5.37]|uniref:DUF2235 domain-containing protein n=1 Tax=Pseudofrankia sp. BMG5.37 TaxID=3050035 RepID=UPI0028950E12|nr:DUF2235 domain-containing protein [Pseudofrankia sp. BMG5.37]MDT3446932.1 DUF2235 domain-containing protein [Pseudofrankia sp. BMG5.37]
MGRNIVVCADGTGNTFDSRPTNVTALIGCIVLDVSRQLVVYDQGIGTTTRTSQVDLLRQSTAERKAFQVLPAPDGAGALGWARKGRGLVTGYGLKENVGQMYLALAECYQPGDRVFLFGFSRGAFTVRALAGLLYRCHLPRSNSGDLAASFDRAWKAFLPVEDKDIPVAEVQALRREHRPCPVHFLGLWDTVKSYGGLNPVILPHLRHNPIVAHVRHALALDERRAWFKPTTWGRLDSDLDAAMSRLKPEDAEAIRQQDVCEIWFTGCHSDVGGGGPRAARTARIALRWMLGEAANVDEGLILNKAGVALLHEADPPGPPVVHKSWTRTWRAVERIPRGEIDNSGLWPVKVPHRGSDGARDPHRSRRSGVVLVHTTVGARHSIPGSVETRATQGPP